MYIDTFMRVGGDHTKWQTRKWKESISFSRVFVPISDTHKEKEYGKYESRSSISLNFVFWYWLSTLWARVCSLHSAQEKDTVHFTQGSHGSRLHRIFFFGVGYQIYWCFDLFHRWKIIWNDSIIVYSMITRIWLFLLEKEKKEERKLNGTHDTNVQFRHMYVWHAGYRVQGKLFFLCLQNALWCATLHTHTHCPFACPAFSLVYFVYF